MFKTLLIAAYLLAAPGVILSDEPFESESVVEILPMRPESAALDERMPQELQEHVWKIAEARYKGEELKLYYAALIGLAEGEGDFKATAYHKNSGGSKDRGMWQINSCWVKTLINLGYIDSSEDLYDPYKCARCADWEFSQCWEKGGGFTEMSYAYYLYGGAHKSSKYTRRVFGMMEKWRKEFYGEKKIDIQSHRLGSTSEGG